MKFRIRLLSPLLGIAGLLAGCGKSGDDPAKARAQASPSPTADPKAVVSERTQSKAASAFHAIDDYLKTQDPKLRDKIEKAANKFANDKDKWRERLKDKQRELEPQIDQLKQQLSKVDGKSGDALQQLRDKLQGLQGKDDDASKKLEELENATGDAWKAFRDRLREDQEKNASPTPTEETRQ